MRDLLASTDLASQPDPMKYTSKTTAINHNQYVRGDYVHQAK